VHGCFGTIGREHDVQRRYNPHKGHHEWACTRCGYVTHTAVDGWGGL